jgi:hypothetical protein
LKTKEKRENQKLKAKAKTKSKQQKQKNKATYINGVGKGAWKPEATELEIEAIPLSEEAPGAPGKDMFRSESVKSKTIVRFCPAFITVAMYLFFSVWSNLFAVSLDPPSPLIFIMVSNNL